MNLYKAYDFNQEDVKVFFAKSEEAAYEHIKVANIEDTKNYILNDLSINEVLEAFKEDKNDALKYLGTGDQDGLAAEYWNKVFRKEWTLLDTLQESKFVYACYPIEIWEHEDVQIIFSNKELASEEIFSELIKRQSETDDFRDYIRELAPNMGFIGRFYSDEQGLTLNCFNDEHAYRKIDAFFKDAPHFAEDFKRYSDEEDVEFSDQFFFYVCKELMESGEWMEYKHVEILINKG